MQTISNKHNVTGKRSRSRSKQIKLKTLGLFLLFILVAYFPLSTFMNFIKEANTGIYLPSRFFMSECMHSNTFPWWNPYINFGMPQYADWNSSFWSPVTWIFAGLFRYNAYTFITEYLLYLFLAGIGMFQLCRNFQYNKTVSYISGFSYMSSGFILGHLGQLNWLGAAAFLPWCLWGYHQLINRYNLKNIMLAALIFYFYFSSAEKGLAIGGIYFFLGYATLFYYQKKEEKHETFSRFSFLKKNAFMLIFLLIFCIGLIVGMTSTAPLIDYQNNASDITALNQTFPLQGVISLFIPAATAKGISFFVSDVSMRSIYIGMTMFLFLIPALIGRKSPKQRFFLLAILFFLFLSLGGFTTYITRFIIPIKTISQTGMLMLFVVFSMIMIAAEHIHQFMHDKKRKTPELEKTFLTLQVLLLACIIIGIGGTIISKHGLIKDFYLVSAAGGINAKLKAIIDTVNIFELMFIQGVIQSILINYIVGNIYKQKYKPLILISAAELALAALIHLPFTGIGNISAKEVEISLEKTPANIPTPSLVSINNLQTNEAEFGAKGIGDWNFYSKRLGVNTAASFPYRLKQSSLAFKNNLSICRDKPYLFSVHGNAIDSSYRFRYFKNNMIDFSVKTTAADTLVYQQIATNNWKCIVNGEKVKPFKYKGVFLAVPLKGGSKNDVKFVYEAGSVQTAFKISMYAFIICMLYIIIVNFRRVALS